MERTVKTEEKKKKQFPHAFVVMLFAIIFCMALTFILTPSAYDRVVVDGKTIVDAASFRYLEKTPITIQRIIAAALDVFEKIPAGFVDSGANIWMMLFIGGFVKVYDSTGAIRAAITTLGDILGEKNKKFVLVAIMFFFGCLGAFPGMLEACIPFAPITLGISLALGYDALVGIFITLVAITLGFGAGPTNVWNAGVGNQLSELPLFSGMSYRMFVFAVFMVAGAIWLLYYTNKITRDPSKSPIYDLDMSHLADIAKYERMAFTATHKVTLAIFVATIGMLVFGSFKLSWGPVQMSTCYLISAIICGVINRYDNVELVETYMEGARTMLVGAAAIGIARAIPLILSQGMIMDTIIHAAVQPLQGLSEIVTASLMMVVQAGLNFLVPSSSGQAMATLPLFLPIGDLVGLSRRVTTLAFQFGDSLSNLIYPTYGGLIAFLLYAKIPYNKWVKFIFPFIVYIYIICMVLMTVAVLVNY